MVLALGLLGRTVPRSGRRTIRCRIGKRHIRHSSPFTRSSAITQVRWIVSIHPRASCQVHVSGASIRSTTSCKSPLGRSPPSLPARPRFSCAMDGRLATRNAPPRTKDKQAGEVAWLARALVRRPSRLLRLVSTSFVSTKLHFGRMPSSSRGMLDVAKLHGQRRLVLWIAEDHTPQVEPRRGVPCNSVGPRRTPATSGRSSARLDVSLTIARASAQLLRSDAVACDADARPSHPSFTTFSQPLHNGFTTLSGGGGVCFVPWTVGFLFNHGSVRFRKGVEVLFEREEKGYEPELRRHNQRPWPRWRCAMAHVCHVAAIAANARRACERGGRKEDLAWRWWASVEPSDKSS